MPQNGTHSEGILERTFEQYCNLKGIHDPIARQFMRDGFFVGAHCMIGIVVKTPDKYAVQVLTDVKNECETMLKKLNPGQLSGPKVTATINGEKIH